MKIRANYIDINKQALTWLQNAPDPTMIVMHLLDMLIHEQEKKNLQLFSAVFVLEYGK